MKILMVTMGLDIGGAETHVLELSLELVCKGHGVHVVSNGGAYEAELVNGGVICYNLPLHSRNPINIIKSYFGLRRIIKDGRFDVVHAHARIPGFICGLLQKNLKFRFMTTTHWVFKTGFLLNNITNWGDRAIAVSDDIKEYLIKHYNYNENHIKVTINGINTDKFTPVAEKAHCSRRIVSVSRMDTDRSAVAFHLLDIAPDLYEI